jgi:putative glutamine amidotransferase
MKWLVTGAAQAQSDDYRTWLSIGGVEGIRIFSSDPMPGDLAPFSALLLTGGGDVDPTRYHGLPAPETSGVDRDRDELECRLIERFMKAKKPVFGICRGIQILNVAFGGKLIQHVPLVLRGIERHGQVDGKDSTHPVLFAKETTLAEILGEVAAVNSAHHQAVDPNAVGRGLRIMAVSGDGIVEAVEGVDLCAPALAVQWHPERLRPFSHPASAGLLNWMKALAKGRCATGSASS